MKPSRSLFHSVLVVGLFALSFGLASGQPATPFTVTLQTGSGGALTLHWPTQNGQRYFIESSPDLGT